MRTSTFLSIVFTVTATLSMTSVHADGWVRIDAPEQFVDRSGVLRRPSCSGGPKLVDSPVGPVPVPADTQYAFFILPGDAHGLAVLWDGGGACWDATTCVGSALLGTPIYNLEVDETVEELETIGGIGDNSNPDNPIAGYTQVFIPYCSGDLHTGANDQIYTFPLSGGGELPWLVHHRGADNVAFVLDWLANYYESEIGEAPRDVFLSGASAGGYGVLYGTPAFAEHLPRSTRVRVLVDAANGVINQDFYDRALTPGGVWRSWENLPPVLSGAFASGPDNIAVELFRSLGHAYPRARFGQYTTAYDATQIFFYNVAENLESIEKWFDPTELAAATFEWTIRARTYQIRTALQTWNYRFYLAQGEDHTVIASDKFYIENTAQGVHFVDWVDDMINRHWPWLGVWQNLSCVPDCLP